MPVNTSIYDEKSSSSVQLIIMERSKVNSVIIFWQKKMFDLNQASYLVQRKQGEQSLSNTPAERLNMNGQGYHQPCNSRLDEIQKSNLLNCGKWTLREIMRYYLFLVQFKHLFVSKVVRKSQRVFSRMAKHIISRKTSQCKSHHQKILKNFNSVEGIVKSLRQTLSPLKEQWKQFQKTQKHALINEFHQINSMQDYYQIFEFKKSIKIYIDEAKIQTYQL